MDGARSPELAVTGTFPADPLAQICGEVAGAYRRTWGRGPAKTIAHWAGPHTLIVLLYSGHTEQEKTMLAAGQIRQVLDGRQLLQQHVEDELKAIPVLNLRCPARATVRVGSKAEPRSDSKAI